MLPLLPVAPPCGFTLGGLLGGALRLWPAANVLDYPAGPGSNLATALTFADPGNYADVYFLPDSAGFTEPQGETEQGPFYKPSLQFVLAQDAPDAAEALARLAGGRFVAAYQDANGFTKLVGTPRWPLRFARDLETGKKPGDRNGYACTLSGETPDPAPFYLEQGLVPPAPRRAFAPGFSFGFS